MLTRYVCLLSCPVPTHRALRRDPLPQSEANTVYQNIQAAIAQNDVLNNVVLVELIKKMMGDVVPGAQM